MPRNGSGGYVLPQPPFVNGTTIDPAPVNSDFSDIADALTGSVAADGQTPMTGDLNLATNSIIGGLTASFTGVVSAANTGQGAVVRRDAVLAIPNNVQTTVTWQTALINDSALWSGGSPATFLVPAGFTRVLLTAQIAFDINATGIRFFRVLHNGITEGSGLPAATNSGSSGQTLLNGAGGLYNVSAGDYFQVLVYQNSGGFLNMLGGGLSWFSIQLMR